MANNVAEDVLISSEKNEFVLEWNDTLSERSIYKLPEEILSYKINRLEINGKSQYNDEDSQNESDDESEEKTISSSFNSTRIKLINAMPLNSSPVGLTLNGVEERETSHIGVCFDLEGNELKFMINELENVQTLVLPSRGISNLNFSAFHFHLHLLETIILNDNHIKYLPSKIFHRCQNLKKIDLSKNGLDEIEKSLFVQCKKLVEIRLKKNQITLLPEDLFHKCKKLKTIDLSKNKITFLPLQLFQKSVKALNIYLSENQIEHIPHGLFQSCKELRTIYLDNNQIKHLPWNTFKECKQLQTIEFSFNQIEEIHLDLFDPNYFKEIIQISFGNNLIRSVPFFHSNKNLKLDFRNNLELELDLPHFLFELFSIVPCKFVNHYFNELYPNFERKDNENFYFCRNVELNSLKETLFTLYLNKKVYNLKNNVCQQFEQYFEEINCQWSILDFLIMAIEKDVFTNENLLYLNSYIQNVIDQDPTLINLEFKMKSTLSIECLCQRDDIRLFHALVDLNNIENRIYDYKNFFENINFEVCFNLVLKETNNEQVAIYLLRMVSYYKSKIESKFNEKFFLFNKAFLVDILPLFFKLNWIEAIEFILDELRSESFLKLDLRKLATNYKNLKNIFFKYDNNQDNIDSLEMNM
jgi:Leucine-rich repeat (LRR) protein